MRSTDRSMEVNPEVREAMEKLAKLLGIEVHVTVTERQSFFGIEMPEDDESLLQEQREAYAWLEDQSRTGDGSYPPLAGFYVVPFMRVIVAASTDQTVARTVAAQALGIPPEKVAVIPVCVRDADAEEVLLSTKRMLGIN